MYRRKNKLLFSKGKISQQFERIYESIKNTIENEKENYILNVNETDYIEHLENRHKLEIPELCFEQVSLDSYEEDIPAEYFPMNANVNRGETYKQTIIQFFVPYLDNSGVLAYLPANMLLLNGTGEFYIQEDFIVAEFIDFKNNADEIKQNYQNEVGKVKTHLFYLKNDINSFNDSLKNYIQSIYKGRREKILNKNNLLASLEIPLRKKENIPTTFSVPKPKLREKIIVKPVVHENGFKAEPSVDLVSYRSILKMINDVGKNFERMPSLYKDKGENDLRDHILMVLDPNFELGNASGETFNAKGKTDIQLRYDSSVVFIAECKFWAGPKKYFSTIDQLLSYLTWRDTKVSIIIFVAQEDIMSILNKIETETPKHTNYLRFENKSDENWFNYRFHINGDRNREIHLAVQVYHIPILNKKKSG